MIVSLPYPPSLNHYQMFVRGRVVLTAKARAYKQTAGLMARAAGMRPIDGPVAVSVHAYRPRRIGDLDNLEKVAFDAMKGVAWHDDKQVELIYAVRLDDAKNPRLEIEVVPMPAVLPQLAIFTPRA